MLLPSAGGCGHRERGNCGMIWEGNRHSSTPSWGGKEYAMHTDRERTKCVQGWRRGVAYIAPIVLALMLLVPAGAVFAKGSKGGGGDGRGAGGGGGANHASSGQGSSGHDSGHSSGHDSGHDDSSATSESHGDTSSGKGSAGKGPAGNGSSGRMGNSAGSDRVSAESDSDDDSDRPDWAKNPDVKPDRSNYGQEKDNKKGDDYGDLFVMLRDDDGQLLYYVVSSDELLNGTLVTAAEKIALCDEGEAACWEVAVAVNADGEVYYVPINPEEDLLDPVLEVELGRLNISRAPDEVLEHALEEALTKLDGTIVNLATWAEQTDLSGRLLSDVEAGIAIDSPLENLALYQAVMDAYDDPGSRQLIDGEEYLIMREDDILGVVEK